MKIAVKIFIILFIPLSIAVSQEERKVLAEIFTNSHCTNCPAAHNAINNYLSTSPNGDRIITVFYHMIYPYNDDPLYHHNSIDSDGRHNYYNPIQATPRGFFDGQIQGSTSTWAASFDNLSGIPSPLKILLSGTKMEESFNIKAEITGAGEIPDNDLVIHFVVIEDLDYTGRNGISHHENVMRKMVDGAFGLLFSINQFEIKIVEEEISYHPDWIKDSLKVVVFIQSNANKTVYQSAIINYSNLNDPTDVSSVINFPEEFKLEQNYPNPFNPSTVISYHLPYETKVTLKIYNILGNEEAILVNEIKEAGIHKAEFTNDGKFSSGVYFYSIKAGEFNDTKKFILLK